MAETSSFYAMILRMKHLQRWGLMRNTISDNLAEHSLDTAVLAHSLCEIGNTYFDKQLDSAKAALLALFHDAGELITGDMPTPIKYSSKELRAIYGQVEAAAAEQLIGRLPEEMQSVYRPLLSPEDETLLPYLKAADKLSALIKCVQEEQSGNREFAGAYRSTLASVQALNLPEVEYFLNHFLPAFSQNLDELV